MEYSLTEGNNNKIVDPSIYIRGKIKNDNSLFENDSKWGEKLRNYKKAKEVFHYDPKVFPRHITTKMINNSEREFNPITQKYYDEKKDQKVNESSKINRLAMISNGYDKQLEVESTYDIINLKNKLAYFNYSDSIKKTENEHGKNDQFNYEKNNIKPYNIISNLSLRKHNFVSPELRPKNDNDLIKSEEGFYFKESNLKNKIALNDKYSRDFNIINNRYKLFNEEKLSTEKQIQNLTSLKKIQNLKTYDIIRGKYINPQLEKQLIEKEKEEREIASKKVDKNYLVRNPVNNRIYDKDEQKRLDDIEFNKKKRFLAKEYLDNYRHSMGNNLEAQKLISHQSYFCPFEFKIHNKLGYDILTNKAQTLSEKNKYLTDIQSEKLMSDWDKLKRDVDENNNTFKTKKIYKGAYDTSDIDINYSDYMKMRKPILEQRSNTIDVNKDKNENKNLNLLKTPIPNKRNRVDNNLSKSIENIINSSHTNVYNKMENRIDYQMKYNNMNKDLFFGTPKAVLKKNQNYNI